METKIDFQSISDYLKKGELSSLLPRIEYDIDTLLEMAKIYLEEIKRVSKTKLVDKVTADAIVDRLEKISVLVKKNPKKLQDKFSLIALYFLQVDDKDNDMDSPMGFDDDAELINLFITIENIQIDKIKLG